MKIAIIEDDIELNNLIKKILKKEGFEADSFYDGESILNSKVNYNLYIVDLNLPKINGIEILELINGKKIVISANIQPKTIDTAYSKGIEDFIKKPFIKEEFLHKIYKIFPKQIKIKDFILKPTQRILLKNNQTIILNTYETKFLQLFEKKEFVTIEEIKQTINKEGNALYVFLSKLRKKTGIEFQNIKGLGYKIKDWNVL